MIAENQIERSAIEPICFKDTNYTQEELKRMYEEENLSISKKIDKDESVIGTEIKKLLNLLHCQGIKRTDDIEKGIHRHLEKMHAVNVIENIVIPYSYGNRIITGKVSLACFLEGYPYAAIMIEENVSPSSILKLLTLEHPLKIMIYRNNEEGERKKTEFCNEIEGSQNIIFIPYT